MEDTTGNPLAVVTGASSGIGRELAARFAENGYDLLLAAEDERIEAAARSLAGPGIQAIPVQADLATFDGVEDLWQLIQATGRVPEAAAARIMPETVTPAAQARQTEPGSGGRPDVPR